MEEGEDSPAGEKSPSEREGATSDGEGSAERDASSPPGSEGEPRRDGGGCSWRSPAVGTCHRSILPGTISLMVHGVN